jgi:hypothetical protein
MIVTLSVAKGSAFSSLAVTFLTKKISFHNKTQVFNNAGHSMQVRWQLPNGFLIVLKLLMNLA